MLWVLRDFWYPGVKCWYRLGTHLTDFLTTVFAGCPSISNRNVSNIDKTVQISSNLFQAKPVHIYKFYSKFDTKPFIHVYHPLATMKRFIIHIFSLRLLKEWCWTLTVNHECPPPTNFLFYQSSKLFQKFGLRM